MEELAHVLLQAGNESSEALISCCFLLLMAPNQVALLGNSPMDARSAGLGLIGLVMGKLSKVNESENKTIQS